MATPLPLEGDGLIENLFYFLWCKDDFGAGPRIYIPHTVLYKFTQPSAWYFTSVKSGKIKKKAKVNLNNVQIEHEFTKKRSASDIVAYYIYFASASNGSGGGGDGAATTIEYFDTEALRDFLYKREKTQNGMLQKFVLPKGTSSSTIRAIWSPKICLLERRVNLRNVHDKRFSIYERGVTFDGADMHSRPEPVRGAMLPGEVQLLCEQIVDHVTQVSYHKYRISRMVLHLKSDADDKLWLLWCSSLRLLNVNASEAAPIRPLDIVHDAHVPEFAMQLSRQSSSAAIGAAVAMAASSGGSDSGSGDKHMGFVRCTSCGLQIEQKKVLATTYKAVLDHFQRFMRFLRLQVNESEHAAIEWPPDERLVQAAGGVGFGILQHPGRGSAKRASQASIGSSSLSTGVGGGNSSGSGSLTRKELVIPPVIQFLHPNFSVDDFERHRQDPLFLHKPVAVCESCCLVYSDYTTTSLEVNSIRQSAPAILRPHCELSDAKKRLDPLDPLAVALAASGGGTLSPTPAAFKSFRKKPPASAWKPVASESKTLNKSKHEATARSTLSSLPSAPQLPQRIDSFDEVQSANFAEMMLASGSSSSGSAGLVASQSASALQQREETFFRELQQQKDLERGHPLHHMLESATRLASSKKQQHRSAQQQRLAALRLSNTIAGDFDTLGKSRSVGALPELLEQQLTGKKAASTKSPYSIVLRLRESTATHETSDSEHGARGAEGGTSELQINQRSSPTKLAGAAKAKKRAGGKKAKVKTSKTRAKRRFGDDADRDGDDDDGDEESSGDAQQRQQMRFVSSREKQASEEYQDFLLAALSQAQAQLEHMESLASLLPDLDALDPVVSPLSEEHDERDNSGQEEEEEEEEEGDGGAEVEPDKSRDDTEHHDDAEYHDDFQHEDFERSDDSEQRNDTECYEEPEQRGDLNPSSDTEQCDTTEQRDNTEQRSDTKYREDSDQRGESEQIDDNEHHEDPEHRENSEYHEDSQARGDTECYNDFERHDDEAVKPPARTADAEHESDATTDATAEQSNGETEQHEDT